MRKMLSLLAAAAAFSLATPGTAAVTITVQQTGSNVIATASGSLNVSGLNLLNPDNSSFSGVCAICSLVGVGAPASVAIYGFGGTGPSTFGGGAFFPATTTSGDAFSFDIFDELGVQKMEIGVPSGFVSGSTINGSATFANQTFAGLGIAPGIYTYTLPSDTITMTIGSVPEPATWAIMLLGLGGVGLAMRRQRPAASPDPSA